MKATYDEVFFFTSPSNSLSFSVGQRYRLIVLLCTWQETGGDQSGRTMEQMTSMKEFGNGQLQSLVAKRSRQRTHSSQGGRGGRLITGVHFRGELPTSIEGVTKDGGDDAKGNGACRLTINTQFSNPISIRCSRKAENRLQKKFVITVVV